LLEGLKYGLSSCNIIDDFWPGTVTYHNYASQSYPVWVSNSVHKNFTDECQAWTRVCVCMCVCVYMCVCVCTCMNACVYLWAQACACVWCVCVCHFCLLMIMWYLIVHATVRQGINFQNCCYLNFLCWFSWTNEWNLR